MFELEKQDPDEAVTVAVYNDFLREEETFYDEWVSGEVYNLKPSMNYTVELRCGYNTLYSETFFTCAPDLPRHDPPVAVVIDPYIGTKENSIFYEFKVERNDPDDIITVALRSINGGDKAFTDERTYEESLVFGEFYNLQFGTTYVIELTVGSVLLYSEQITPQTPAAVLIDSYIGTEENCIFYEFEVERNDPDDIITVALRSINGGDKAFTEEIGRAHV